MNWSFFTHLFFFFLAGAASNLIFTPLSIWLANRFGIIDHPGSRKIHKAPVPKLGGLAIFLSISSAVGFGLAFFPENPTFLLTDIHKLKLGAILLVTFLGSILGFADDYYSLKPRTKFIFQALIAGSFSIFGYHFQVLHLPSFQTWNLYWLGIPITTFWMMAVINGFNFTDILDGLAGVVSLVTFAGLLVAGFFLNATFLMTLSATAMGVFAVFLIYNWTPAKVYLGDTGASAIGIFIAASLISLGQNQPPGFFSSNIIREDLYEPFRFQMVVVTFLIGYPALEVTLSTARRGIRKFLYGRSMEWSEKQHIAHRLLKLGLKAPAVCAIAASFQIFLIIAGILAMNRENALGVLCVIPDLLILAYFMPRLGFFDFLHPQKILHEQPHFQIAHHFIGMQKTKLSLASSQEEVLVLINQTCLEFGIQGCIVKLNSNGNETGKTILHFSWERSLEDQREHLNYIKTSIGKGDYHHFKDQIILAENKGEAVWTFEPHTTETELDVEYRVLVSDFMKEALNRLPNVESHNPEGKSINSHQNKISSSSLHRRHTKGNK